MISMDYSGKNYIVTGGAGGIGGAVVDGIVAGNGHAIIVDINEAAALKYQEKYGKDKITVANVDLSNPAEIREKFGQLVNEFGQIHGLICVAGVAGTCGDMKLMFSLNYFGVTGLAYGIYDLLKKKGGSCVVIVSNTISQGGVHMDLCDMLNYACNQDRNEARILSILEQYDGSNMTMAQGLYATTKYALARWVRRISASWGANGVRINAVAPGNVRTPLTAAMGDRATAALAGLPIPINYQTGDQLLDPVDIANVLVFLVSPAAHGVNGNIMFVDGGTDALLNSEKVY